MSDPAASARGPRVLVVSRQHAHPPRNGGALREMHIIRALAALGPTWVFALAAGGPPPPDLPVAGWTSSQDRAASMPEGGDVMGALRDGRSPFHVTVSETATRELLALVDEFAPDVVVVRGNEIATYVPHLRATGARLIVDADYAFAESLATMGAGDSNRARGITWRHAASLVARVEAEMVALVDQIWVAHTESQDSLRGTYPDAPSITVVPNVVDVGSYSPSPRTNPWHVVYPGRFDFWPNEDAAATLINDVLPLLEQASVSIVGMAPTPWMREVTDPRVTVTGAVDDIRPYLCRAGVMAVPLQVGSGTRLKVLEAFAAALPVVSTAKGVEGLALVDREHYLNAETPAEFAAAIETLVREPAPTDAIITRAHALVDARYSLPALEGSIQDALAIAGVHPATN